MSLSFEPKTLAALAALINETGLTEIELEEGDRKVRLVRALPPVNMAVAAPMAAMPAPAPAAFTAPAAAPAAAPAFDAAQHPGTVKSPMVGVAYLSAEPGTPPYVSVGQKVEAGATVLLIEAMKTFNQIKAPKAGTVTSVLIASGSPVEFDEPLLIIE